jgi:hypothetical protein
MIWIVSGLIVLVLLAALSAFFYLRDQLPEQWPLAARPIMSAEELVLFDRMRVIFPEYIVLAKVPLSRFMRLETEAQADKWFRVLNPLHVSYVVCSLNRRVICAVDAEGRHGRSSVAHDRKAKALKTCGIRYLTIPLHGGWSDPQIRNAVLAPMPVEDQAENAQSVFDPDYSPSVFGADQAQVDAVRERIDKLRSSRKRGFQNSGSTPDSFIGRGDDSKS